MSEPTEEKSTDQTTTSSSSNTGMKTFFKIWVLVMLALIVAYVIVDRYDLGNSPEKEASKLDKKYGKPIAILETPNPTNTEIGLQTFLRDCRVTASGDVELTVTEKIYDTSIWKLQPEHDGWKAQHLCDLLNGNHPTDEELDKIFGPRKDFSLENYGGFYGFRSCVIGKSGAVTISINGSDAQTLKDPGKIQAEEGFCQLLPGATADIEIYPKAK